MPILILQNLYKLTPEEKEKLAKGEELKEREINTEQLKETIGFYFDIVKRSYPDLPNDVIDNFIATNFAQFNKVVEKLVPQEQEDSNRKRALDKIKQLQQARSPQAKKPE